MLCIDYGVNARCDLDARNPLHDKLGRDSCLGLTDVLLSFKASQGHRQKRIAEDVPKQELTVKIADVDGVHIDDMDILEASESKVSEDLTAETTSADDKYLRLVSEKVLDLNRGLGELG